MERTFASSRAQWAYEETSGIRVKTTEQSPDEETLTSAVPQPEIEQVTLDTVVLYEGSQEGIDIFKFAFDKERLGNFLAYYVEYLDADGRQALRSALEDSSGLVVPEVSVRGLRLVPETE